MAKSELLEQVRQEIRRRNYSYKTEQSYTSWIVRYVKYHGTVHPEDLTIATRNSIYRKSVRPD